MEHYNTVQRCRHGKNSQECHSQNLRHLPLWENAMWRYFTVSKHCTGCLGESACCFLYFACEVLLCLLFIEPVQGTQAQFSSGERHIRISTSGDFSRTLKCVKCYWIPFDFVLSLVKPASVCLHLSALNVLNFDIKSFHWGRIEGAQPCRGVCDQDIGLGYVPGVYCFPKPQRNDQDDRLFPFFSPFLVIYFLLLVQTVTVPTGRLERGDTWWLDGLVAVKEPARRGAWIWVCAPSELPNY